MFRLIETDIHMKVAWRNPVHYAILIALAWNITHIPVNDQSSACDYFKNHSPTFRK